MKQWVKAIFAYFAEKRWTFPLLSITVRTSKTGYTKEGNVMSKFFTDNETTMLDHRLVQLLDIAREAAGVPFIIESGYRTPEHNKEIGGVPESAHTKGLAVDIRCLDNHARYRILKGLFYADFRRIEIADRHIHADLDESKPDEIVWLGISV